ncbi:HAD-IIA family hydrolase [Actinokineospora iranica]|uniref:Haloacid Dehalogenase Superfamily Class (Subfamily) IIA n=1 Tax=Actinokineospora iranica TaxID=1271860 RepID=A0A1G6XGP7_9PSEU|nr:HAD-IIA family hydrolase [Actinokineospora iranica]SDD77404.1 Haloacid Dehalogenase Superfamily Class (subfamily) IIA [Actinokineospora iranica]
MSDRLLDLYDAVLADLDGTVYRGGEAVVGAAESLDVARERGVVVRFVTNNASRAPLAVAAHLTGLGIAAQPGEVSTSAQAGAALVAQRLDAGAEVLVLGTDALAAEVAAVGLVPVRAHGDGTQAVLQGLSPELAWRDLAEAAVAIRAGALWVACNVDRTLPTERGLLPGNGSLVAALRVATDREPLVAGKPAAPLLTEAIRSAGAERPLVVGDRLDTDIAGAAVVGADSLLVLTGVSTALDLVRAGPDERPTYVAADIQAITESAATLEIGPKAGWDVRLTADRRVEVSGDGDPLDLLRALCATWWDAGSGPPAFAVEHPALAVLGLTGPR